MIKLSKEIDIPIYRLLDSNMRINSLTFFMFFVAFLSLSPLLYSQTGDEDSVCIENDYLRVTVIRSSGK